MLNDNYCRYDKITHRYVLTTDFVLEKKNIDLYDTLNTSGAVSDVAKAPEIFLDRISMQIYEYIYAQTPYPFVKERDLALKDEYRQPIMDAMTEQMLYVLNNGDISVYSGINAISGMTLDAQRMRYAQVSPVAMDILQNRGVVSRRILPYYVDDTPTYEKDGY